jgi:hypothetical protein
MDRSMLRNATAAEGQRVPRAESLVPGAVLARQDPLHPTTAPSQVVTVTDKVGKPRHTGLGFLPKIWTWVKVGLEFG